MGAGLGKWRDPRLNVGAPTKVMGALFLELKATQMPFNNKMAKYIVMFVYNGILHSNGK